MEVLNNFELLEKSQLPKKLLVKAQVGLTCAVFSRKLAKLGVSGAEFLSGIPGTIGGALAMNAGAFGSDTWSHVTALEMINEKGEVNWCEPEDFDVAYRYVKYKNDSPARMWFLSAIFSFEKNEKILPSNQLAIKELLEKRAQSQPTQQATAGSVFKNPKGNYAARLIEQSGLKGLTINDAQISEKHANFIVNKGSAKASDVEQLIKKIKKKVFKKFNIQLETEVKIIGDL